VEKYPFLSDEWVAAARQVRRELSGNTSSSGPMVRVNLVVTEVPFGPGSLDAHLDTSAAEIDIEAGHLANPDVTLTLDYPTAKAILVEGHPQVALQAFMSGKIRVDGDLSKLMVLQSLAVNPDPTAVAIARRVREMTE
jgi:putative sterol carrier protein